jgi:hypothetical protein
MNFNYILSTGDPTISGSISSTEDRNRLSFLSYVDDFFFQKPLVNLDSAGKVKKDSFFFDPKVITGDQCSLVSLNSQTLFEGQEQINYSARWNYYSLNTGDYFVDLVSGSNSFQFAEDLPTSVSDIVFYDKRDAVTGVLTYSTSSFNSSAIDALRSKAHAVYSNAGSEGNLFENYDVFLNGQKLKQNEYPSSTVTGSLFAIPKKDEINALLSEEPDVYGSGFIDNQITFYLNGMAQDLEDVLTMYTGVYTIETGVDSSIPNVEKTTENYLM